jgi:hypothetical protein
MGFRQTLILVVCLTLSLLMFDCGGREEASSASSNESIEPELCTR